MLSLISFCHCSTATTPCRVYRIRLKNNPIGGTGPSRLLIKLGIRGRRLIMTPDHIFLPGRPGSSPHRPGPTRRRPGPAPDIDLRPRRPLYGCYDWEGLRSFRISIPVRPAGRGPFCKTDMTANYRVSPVLHSLRVDSFTETGAITASTIP